MPILHRLTAARVAKMKTPGRFADGGGLWIQVKSANSRSWIFRYTLVGRARHMGLGAFPDVLLAAARDKAAQCRRQLRDGIDPLEARREVRDASRLASAKAMTFRQCAAAYIAANEIAWKNAKHRQQWRSTLRSYAYPIIGDLPVAEVDTGLVMQVIEPIWSDKPETASRLRGRIESILNWAKARGYRRGENPATWRGHLDQLLPPRRSVRKVRHHPALPYAELPAFMAELRGRDGVAARALEFLILTATRTGETIGARWDEIDGKAWAIPAERMKADRAHRVPLSRQAQAILAAMPREGKFVFPGGRAGAPLSNMALLAMLRRMGRRGVTAHGFRSTFRDWCAETTTFPAEVGEAALAHTVADRTEAAYRRGDLFLKRASLMAAWGDYCTGAARPGKVLPMRGR